MFETIVRFNRKVVFVDLDDVVFDYKGAWLRAIEANPKIQYPQAIYKFYENLEPLPNAIESIHFLDKIGYEVFLATRQSAKNPLCYTEKAVSVEKHLGFEYAEKLFIAPDKTLLIGDYLIDDNIWEGFKGEMIHFGSERFPEWNAVVNYLECQNPSKK